MPIPISCPSCEASLAAPDAAVGKWVACPKCDATLPVPVPAAEDFLVVEVAPRSTPPPAKDPRRATSPAKRLLAHVVLALMGGMILCVGISIGWYLRAGGGGGFVGGLLGGPPPPPGYSAVGDPAVGVRLVLPGVVRGGFGRQGPDGVPNPNRYLASLGSKETQFYATREPGFTPGETPDQLFVSYEALAFLLHPRKYEVTERRPVTLGGRPGLELHVKELPDLWDIPPRPPGFWKDKDQGERERVAREGMFYVVLVVGHGEWTYVISLARKLAEPDPETVKTVSESIKFI